MVLWARLGLAAEAAWEGPHSTTRAVRALDGYRAQSRRGGAVASGSPVDEVRLARRHDHRGCKGISLGKERRMGSH
jgi:hypothetical protein